MMLAMGMFMETVFGSRRMLVFFVFSGLCGALCYFIYAPFAVIPVVGASGSISGLFAVTILILHGQGRLGIEKKSALPLLLFWVALTIGIGLIGGGIAWQAHLGGFLGALGLFYALRKRWINF
jgi:membrane associated rhomboid family serine protease